MWNFKKSKTQKQKAEEWFPGVGGGRNREMLFKGYGATMMQDKSRDLMYNRYIVAIMLQSVKWEDYLRRLL